MSEPAFSVEGVLDALAMQPRRGPRTGRSIMFVAAHRKAGVTSAAVAVARAAGPNAVYALDLDLKRNALAKALSENETLGPRIDGRLNGVSFYTIRGAAERTPVFGYHRVGRTKLFAGVFDTRLLPRGAGVAVSSGSEYWDAARAGGATVVVDAPALERSSIALRVARHMDGVVLVVGAQPGAAPVATLAKEQLLMAGANLMGLVYAGADRPTMAIDRLLRQAG